MTTESTSSETSTQQKEFSPYFLWWLVILTVGTLLLLRFDDHYYSILSYFPLPSNFATIFVLSLSYSPWLIAGAITISNGITEFSGDAYKLITVGVELSSLIGILTGFIVGPTLFFFAWRKAKESLRLSFSRTEHFSPSTINFILGGIVCIPILVVSTPSAFYQWVLHREAVHRYEVQRNKDLLERQTVELAYATYEQWILPSKLGGDDNDFRCYKIDESSLWGSHNTDGKFEIMYASKDSITFRTTSKRIPNSVLVAAVSNLGIRRPHVESGFLEE